MNLFFPEHLKLDHSCDTGPYVPESLLLQWHLTERCNLRCRHCYQEVYSGDELSFQQWLGIIEQFQSLLGRWRTQRNRPRLRGHITVTGGEPFVRPDFFDLLRRFHQDRAWYSFAILTNGSMIDAQVAKELAALRPAFVQVSIEGIPETHDRLRGEGNHARTVAAIRQLVRRGIQTLISFTAHRENFREFPGVVQLARQLRVHKVWSDRFLPNGAGMQHLGGEALTPDETREYFRLMAETRATARRAWFSRTEVMMHRALQFLEGDGRPYFCKAGDSLITVMPNGDVLPCRRMPVAVGNLVSQPLETIYETSPLLRQLRDPHATSSGCEGCFYSQLCRGGLKCLSYAVHGDPFVRDPGCWHNPEEDPTETPAQTGCQAKDSPA